jgi:hypothetical protein
MFRTVRLPIIRSLFTVNSTMVYAIQVRRQLSSRTRVELIISECVYVCVCVCIYIYVYIYIYVCVYIYIYIYIYETGFFIDRFMENRVYLSHHPAGRDDRSESEQILCSNATRNWTGSAISRRCTFVVPWNNYGRQVIRTAHTHAHARTLNWRLTDQNYHAWDFRWAELTSGSRFWYESIICGVATSSHTHRHWECAARHVPSWSPNLSPVPPSDVKVSVGVCQSAFINEVTEEHDAL